MKRINTFGELVRRERLLAGMSLRVFCERLEIDASNYSKVERGRLPFTYNKRVLRRMAVILGYKKDSLAEIQLFDAAMLASKIIPAEIYTRQQAIEQLPVFIRCVTGKLVYEDEAEKLIEILQNR